VDGKDGGEPILAVPILLRDQPIGALGFRLPPGKKDWNKDDIAIAETVSEQFGLAAETIRLLEETQHRAARERLVSEITTKIRSTNDPQEMLQTAVFELRQALQAKRAQAILQPENDGLNRPKDKRTK
jgi:GAF domain-containing protein